jgi:hypothetical protein
MLEVVEPTVVVTVEPTVLADDAVELLVKDPEPTSVLRR